MPSQLGSIIANYGEDFDKKHVAVFLLAVNLRNSMDGQVRGETHEICFIINLRFKKKIIFLCCKHLAGAIKLNNVIFAGYAVAVDWFS